MELIIGYMNNSVALVADAFHMLSDVIALIVGLVAVRFQKKRSFNKNYTYGYLRAEVVGALCNAVFLLALCFTIIIDAIKHIVSPERMEDPKQVLIVGAIGLFINVVGLFMFSGSHGHSHGGHGHSHGITISEQPSRASQGQEIGNSQDIGLSTTVVELTGGRTSTISSLNSATKLTQCPSSVDSENSLPRSNSNGIPAGNGYGNNTKSPIKTTNTQVEVINRREDGDQESQTKSPGHSHDIKQQKESNMNIRGVYLQAGAETWRLFKITIPSETIHIF